MVSVDSCSESADAEATVLDEAALLEKCKILYFIIKVVVILGKIGFAQIGEDYVQLVFSALKTIDLNPPVLITGGSSGSYFIHNEQKVSNQVRVDRVIVLFLEDYRSV